MRILWTCVVVCLLWPVCITVAQDRPFNSSQPDYPKWSAFTNARVGDDEKVMVEYEGEWVELMCFHGQSTDAIVDFAKERVGEKWKERIIEDLVQLIRLMGEEIDEETNIVIRAEDGHDQMIDVTMTRGNRNRLISAQHALEDGPRRRRPVPRPVLRGRLGGDELTMELQTFQNQLEAQFAYYEANDVDLDALIADTLARNPEGMTRDELSLEITRLLGHFIDGHARASGLPDAEHFLPFIVEASGDRFVAFHADRESLVNDDFPFITKIDGEPIQQWLESFDPLICLGSDQYRRNAQVGWLRDIGFARKLMGAERTDEPLEVELVNDAGETTSVTLDVADRFPRRGAWPRTIDSSILDDHNIGYLRLNAMDDESKPLVEKWMPEFRETDGLIIDVRGNGGGSREALVELAPYLMTADDQPRIGNVCKYRLYDEFGEHHLSSARFVYRRDSSRFGDDERAAIDWFMGDFQPQWEPPADKFSEWHYLVFSKTEDDPRYDYTKPVIILMDERCFSATDIFLGSFKGWPNVTLVGQASGGGSARSQSFELPLSDLRVRCASMASFQPNGKLYDTNGVEPDVNLEREPDYYLNSGRDSFLEKAIEIIQSNQ
ncbi:MAG: S41 family peptidase [Pirellulaceae bacterium]